MAKPRAKDWKTKLIHADVKAPEGFQSLVEPVYRGSTVVFPSAGSTHSGWDPQETGYSYGTHGTPTVLELAVRVCELEGGSRTLIVSSGLAAISLIHLALLKTGDHVLIPDSAYAPNRAFARALQKFGVDCTFYPPCGDITSLVRQQTKAIWCESPGSITMEVQDVPAIVRAAKACGALVVMDNTWSAGVFFDAFAHGVDITLQALTKYVAGHSDVLLGSVTVRDEELFQKIGGMHSLMGCSVSPDECSLALRGLKTMAVRLKAVEKSALSLAQWLSARPEVELVLHPALDSCPGHDLWERDFVGSSGLFSIVMRKGLSRDRILRFIDDLELFQVGWSWGGVASLAVSYDLGHRDYGGRLVRLSIGLEDVEDLRADLERGLKTLSEE